MASLSKYLDEAISGLYLVLHIHLLMPHFSWVPTTDCMLEERLKVLTHIGEHRTAFARAMRDQGIDYMPLFKLRHLTCGSAAEEAGQQQLRAHLDCFASLQALAALMPARSPGRPKPARSTRARDRRLFDAWSTKQYRTFAELAQDHGIEENAARRAVDRERKHRKTAELTAVNIS